MRPSRRTDAGPAVRTHTHSGGRRVNLILRVQNVRQKIGQNYTYLLAAGSGIWNFGIYAKKKNNNKNTDLC